MIRNVLSRWQQRQQIAYWCCAVEAAEEAQAVEEALVVAVAEAAPEARAAE